MKKHEFAAKMAIKHLTKTIPIPTANSQISKSLVSLWLVFCLIRFLLVFLSFSDCSFHFFAFCSDFFCVFWCSAFVFLMFFLIFHMFLCFCFFFWIFLSLIFCFFVLFCVFTIFLIFMFVFLILMVLLMFLMFSDFCFAFFSLPDFLISRLFVLIFDIFWRAWFSFVFSSVCFCYFSDCSMFLLFCFFLFSFRFLSFSVFSDVFWLRLMFHDLIQRKSWFPTPNATESRSIQHIRPMERQGRNINLVNAAHKIPMKPKQISNKQKSCSDIEEQNTNDYINYLNQTKGSKSYEKLTLLKLVKVKSRRQYIKLILLANCKNLTLINGTTLQKSAKKNLRLWGCNPRLAYV